MESFQTFVAAVTERKYRLLHSQSTPDTGSEDDGVAWKIVMRLVAVSRELPQDVWNEVARLRAVIHPTGTGQSFAYIDLQMTEVDAQSRCWESERDAWCEKHWAEVRGEIGSLPATLYIHAVPGNGDCFYLALAISIFMAWGSNCSEEVLRGRLQQPYADRLLQVIEIGRCNVAGTDRKAFKLRKLLYNFADQNLILEGILAEKYSVAARASTTRTRTGIRHSSPFPVCDYYRKNVLKQGIPADDAIFFAHDN